MAGIERYEDFYGCTGVLLDCGEDGYFLVTRTPGGKKIRDEYFKTRRGALRAMNTDSDGTFKKIK